MCLEKQYEENSMKEEYNTTLNKIELGRIRKEKNFELIWPEITQQNYKQRITIDGKIIILDD